jgi:hypothetical protein
VLASPTVNRRLEVAREPEPFRRRPARLLLAGLAVLLSVYEHGDVRGQGPPPPGSPLFVEVAAAAGLDFVHHNGASGEFYYPELMHSGAAFLDYDNDRFLDAYLVQAGPLPVEPHTDRNANRLYRNRGDGTFEDVTATAGVGDRGYGTGLAVADYDRDGDVDIYATNLGRNTLYRNNGDGTFTDVTAEVGVGDRGYSTSAAFVDLDADGDLDLYVCNYLEWSPEIERACYGLAGLRGYCSPIVYDRPQPDSLYRNNGDGTFTDVSQRSGIRADKSTGLGVATADFDGDGHVDIYVANDQMANFLWMNNGDGTFREEALIRGCALNEDGMPEAGMGVTTEDIDDDGDWDLFMAHLSGETNTFYRNVGGGFFRDVTHEMRLGAISQPYTGFGTSLFDYNADGYFDLFIANGKVRLGDTMDYDYAEPNLLLRGGPGGTFQDVSDRSEVFSLVEVSRGAAFGDYDNDGDLDILMSNNEGPVRLLRNEAQGDRHWLTVQLVGRTADRDAIGSLITIVAGGRQRRRLVQPAYSYCSSNDPRIHFGLGELETVDLLTVRWPGGQTEERRNVAADEFLRLVEPQ